MASSPDRIVSFRLPQDLVRRLEHIASCEDRSLSAVLRLAATRYVVQAEAEFAASPTRAWVERSAE